MAFVERLKGKVKELNTDACALYYAYKDPRVPWHAKAVAACVVAYALSPIDLIPDFIPVLGHLDDLVLIPLGIKLALKLVPQEVYEECRAKVCAEAMKGKPVNRTAAAAIIALWLLLAAALVIAAIRVFRHK